MSVLSSISGIRARMSCRDIYIYIFRKYIYGSFEPLPRQHDAGLHSTGGGRDGEK